MAKDYYVILGLSADASPEEIKTAYRRCAMELHPDHSGADHEEFLNAQEAYHTLIDPHRRSHYDHQRLARRHSARGEIMRQRRPAEPLRSTPPPQDLGTMSLDADFETQTPSIDDIFGRLFNNFQPGDPPKAETVRSLTIDIPISAEQALYGGIARIEVPTVVICPTCGGHGGMDLFTCVRCAGHGRLIHTQRVPVSFPPDLRSDYVTQIPLNTFGIHNTYLTVRFRVSELAV